MEKIGSQSYFEAISRFHGDFIIDVQEYLAGDINMDQFLKKQLWHLKTNRLLPAVIAGTAMTIGVAGILVAVGAATAVGLGLIGGAITLFLGSWVVFKIGGWKFNASFKKMFGVTVDDAINRVTEKATFIFEAMIVLETNDITELNEEDVKSKFRRKVLQYHPDKQPKILSDAERQKCIEMFHASVMAKNILLGYLSDESKTSRKVKKKVQEMYEAYKKEKKGDDLDSAVEHILNFSEKEDNSTAITITFEEDHSIDKNE